MFCTELGSRPQSSRKKLRAKPAFFLLQVATSDSEKDATPQFAMVRLTKVFD